MPKTPSNFSQRLIEVIISVKFALILLLINAFLIVLATVYEGVFHSPVLILSLAVLWLSLLVLLCRKVSKINKQCAGAVLMHAAALLILTGGLISRVYGEKGILKLSEGQSFNNFETFSKKGISSVKELPFSLRLLAFDVSYYEQKKRLYFYEFDKKEGLHFPLKSWSKSKLIKGIRVLDYFIRLHEADAGVRDSGILEITKESKAGGKKTLELSAVSAEPLMLDEKSGEIIVYEPSPKRVREFLSRIVLRAENGESTQHEIKVNHPLSLGSYMIYQSSYDPNRLDLSVLQIVYDPGLYWVYAGFMLLASGVFWLVLITPIKGRLEN